MSVKQVKGWTQVSEKRWVKKTNSDAFHKGAQAALAGKSESDNPYTQGGSPPDGWESWNAGFKDAKRNPSQYS